MYREFTWMPGTNRLGISLASPNLYVLPKPVNWNVHRGLYVRAIGWLKRNAYLCTEHSFQGHQTIGQLAPHPDKSIFVHPSKRSRRFERERSTAIWMALRHPTITVLQFQCQWFLSILRELMFWLTGFSHTNAVGLGGSRLSLSLGSRTHRRSTGNPDVSRTGSRLIRNRGGIQQAGSPRLNEKRFRCSQPGAHVGR